MNISDQDRVWQNKLMALLHDPPEKAFNYGPEHEVRAEQYATLFDFSQQQFKDYKSSDWSSAAADRFIFPSGQAIHQQLGGGVGFIHPLSGMPAFRPADFPSEQQAHEVISKICPDFSNSSLDARERFFLTWRLWMEFAASHQADAADKLPYLPADTRVPDGSIWAHNAVAAALEATRAPDGVLRPAFLLAQVGPVQDFIAQARTTRDLWSGSYLLSWLMSHALMRISKLPGPDAVIFPSLRGQPLFDWLNRSTLEKACFKKSLNYLESITRNNLSAWEEMVLTPNLPNCFLALVPENFDPQPVVNALQEEWQTIARVCREFLEKHGCPISKPDRYERQVARVWDVTWQIWPWQSVGETMQLFKTIPTGRDNNLHNAYNVAREIPSGHRDNRCYRHGEPDPGWAWSAHYQLCRHRLDARRQTRDFHAWPGEPAAKDVYSGRDEIVIDEAWLEKIRRNKELGHLFRGEQEELLGAVNLIKRVWHKAYLDKEKGLKRAKMSFDSVPAVAAAPWRASLLNAAGQNHDTWQALLDFKDILQKTPDMPIEFPDVENEKQWINKVDAAVFQETFLEKIPAAREASEALGKLCKTARVGRPQKYYAVLAFDGDNIGKWLGGEKTPPVKKVLTSAAVDYFKKSVPGDITNKWLDNPRPVSPSYHLQFSEALANFGLYCARRIIEHHHGQLIYAGGDDVLAMLPATEAIPCAYGLHLAFQGATELPQRYPAMFKSTSPGFVHLQNGDWNAGARHDAEPTWPLLVPGSTATASAGIAMGHIREPLQDIVQSARQAEKRAKNLYGRDALALTLFKRSGEQIQWGTKFQPDPFKLLDFLNRGDTYKPPVDHPERIMPISGKFPYRICELLRVYERHTETGAGAAATPLDDRMHDVAEKEIAWAIGQLRSGNKPHNSIFDELADYTGAWLDAVHAHSGSLSDFYNLFAVEAFIARQGD